MQIIIWRDMICSVAIFVILGFANSCYGQEHSGVLYKQAYREHVYIEENSFYVYKEILCHEQSIPGIEMFDLEWPSVWKRPEIRLSNDPMSVSWKTLSTQSAPTSNLVEVSFYTYPTEISYMESLLSKIKYSPARIG